MVSRTVYFKDMMVFTLTSQMYHGISVLAPVLVRVPDYLSTSTSTSTSTMTLELTSTSTVRVPEIQYSITACTSTEYEYPSPGRDHLGVWVGMPELHQRQCSSCHQVGILNVTQSPLSGSWLPMPGSDLHDVLQTIHEDQIFGLAQVDVHISQGLKDKLCDFKSTEVSTEDAGPLMAGFCDEAGLVSQPHVALISDYFAHRMLIPTHCCCCTYRMGWWSCTYISCCSNIGNAVSSP